MTAENSGAFASKTVKGSSKFTYILDNGHGDIHPITGKYVTPGKRSPKFDDGSQLFEGANNRDNVNRIMKVLEAKDIKCVNLVDTFLDIKLSQRAESVNDLASRTDCVLISIHSDGAGNGRDWHDAKGVGVFVYSNASKRSLDFADVLSDKMKNNFTTPFRGIRAKNFAILRETNCPAVLIEFGFHTHKEECAEMLTEEWKENVVKTVVQTIETFEKL